METTDSKAKFKGTFYAGENQTYNSGMYIVDDTGAIRMNIPTRPIIDDYGNAAEPLRIEDDYYSHGISPTTKLTIRENPRVNPNFAWRTINAPEEIKPCPFCGRTTTAIVCSPIPIGLTVRIQCLACGSEAPAVIQYSEISPEIAEWEAYAYWNRRQPPQE